MWRRYVVALVLLLTVVVGGHFFSISASHSVSSDKYVGKLIARQEALSQLILVTSLRLVGEQHEMTVRAELEMLIDEFEAAHKLILDGAGNPALRPVKSERLRAIYYDGSDGEEPLNAKLRLFLREAWLIHTANLEGDNFIRERIDILRELDFYTTLKNATEAFQLDADDRARRLHFVQLAILIVGLTTIVAEAVFIFFPAHLSTKASLLRLEDKSRELQRTNERLSDSLFQAQLARREADQSSRAKTMFLANMSHELRTPLNAIIGFSSMIKSEIFGPVGNEKYKDYVADIEKSGTHLLELIGDLMDISQVEAGVAQLEPKNVNISDLITDIEGLVRGWTLARERQVHFVVGDDIGEYYGDPLRMRQIVLNLLSNAIKFTDRNAVVTVSALSGQQGALDLIVEDTGNGFDLEQVSTLLQPFQRGDDALTRSREGTGLGLSLVVSFAKLHGGYVTVDNKDTGGGRVTVHLPPSITTDGKISAAA